MMWRISLAAFLTAALSLFALNAAHAQFNGCSAGFCSPPAASGGTTYSGPVDAVASATACWALRACSSAVRGNAAIQACDASGANCADVLTDATTGSLPASITRGATNCSGGTCTVKIVYDQTGSNCSGPCNFSQSTTANQALLTHNCINTSLWCLTFTASNFSLYPASGTFGTINQPYTESVVIKRTSAFTTQGCVLCGGNSGLGYESSANTAFLLATTQPDFTVTDNAWQSIQAIFNAGSSLADVNGTTTSLNTGTALSLTNPLFLGVFSNGSSIPFTGTFVEALIYPIGFNSTQYAAMTSNQRTYWGF
jgi:hypothetical protein